MFPTSQLAPDPVVDIGSPGLLALDASITALQVSQGSLTSGQMGMLLQGAVTTSAPVYTNGQTRPLSLDTSGLFRVSLKDTPANTNRFLVDGSGVTQPVSGTFWQATQPVSGTFWQATQPVSGTFFQATQPVSGTFFQATQPVSIASMPSTPVTGTFWQATQPVSGTITANAGTGTFAVSAAALPLPSGASTSAKQPALGAAGTASADVITVQGIASMTALKMDGSGVTQPVSIASMPSTPVTGTFWQATQPVSGTFFQATQPVSGTFWQATQPVSIASMPSTPVTGTFWQATQPVSGTVTTTPPSNASSNIAQINAVTPLMGNGLTGTGSQRVTIASDNTAFAVNATLGAGTAVVGHVINDASTAVIGHVIADSGSTTAVTGTVTVSGTVTTTPPANASSNIAQVNGVAPLMGNGTTGTGSQRVTIASDNTAFAVNSTLAAETTKVIGTVNMASSQTIAVTQATAANLNAAITPPTLTKGTQGSTGISTQDLKDAGRSYVVLYASGVAGVTSEALVTFTKNVNGTATTAQTAYTITSGKTFRIQTLQLQVKNTTTTANNIIVNVRVAGSVSASSPIVLSGFAAAQAATATNAGYGAVDVPDGMEIKGDGTLQIGISHLENITTAAITYITLTGYEY